MEPSSLCTIDAVVKIRSGKKWKKRYCRLQRSSSRASSDVAFLCIHKKIKCGLKSTRKKKYVCLEGFYGLESGFDLDKENRTLAIICHSCVVVAAFEHEYTLDIWKKWLRDLFGYSCNYKVLALQLPSNLINLRNSCFRLHLRYQRFCLVHEWPPVIVAELSFQDLRRFGATSDRNFVLEAGSRAGFYAGLYVFNTNDLEHMVWAFQVARDGPLNDYLPTRRGEDYQNTRIDSTPDQPSSTSYQSGYQSSASKGNADDQYPTHGYDEVRLRNRRGDRLFLENPECSRPDLKPRLKTTHIAALEPVPSCHVSPEWSRNYENACGCDRFAMLSKQHGRPTSAFEPSCSSRTCRTTMASSSNRPISELYPKPRTTADGGQIMAPMLGACRCRNYVNQQFIDSLQYYYNIDHVVLALSKKSKCCDHVCTGQSQKETEGILVDKSKDLLAASAKINGGGRDDSVSVVNVPSTDYAAMAPKGSLYVLMEPPTPDHRNVQKRNSQSTVPDDPSPMLDESNVVTVPDGKASRLLAARSGIVVKPFEPLIVNDRRSLENRGAIERPSEYERMELLNDRLVRNHRPHSVRAKRESIQQRSIYVERSQSSESKASNNVLRSASFVTRDILRSSTRKAKSLFGGLARRASSAMLRKQRESARTSDLDERRSRATSEPAKDLALEDLDGDAHFGQGNGRYHESVDLDDVIYEGYVLTGKTKARPWVKKEPIGPQRSIGTESTVSNDSSLCRGRRAIGTDDRGDSASVSDSCWDECNDAKSEKEHSWRRAYVPVGYRSDAHSNGRSYLGRMDAASYLNESAAASGYDGDGSTDGHTYLYASKSMIKTRNASASTSGEIGSYPQPITARRRSEKRTAAYSPPPPFDGSISPPPARSGAIPVRKPTSRRHSKTPAPLPPPHLEGDVFKFPPMPYVMDDYGDVALLNYATLANQDASTPTPVSTGGSGRYSLRRPSSPTTVRRVEYAKIDEVATQAARKAVITSRPDGGTLERFNSSRTLSDGEQSVEMSQSMISQRSVEKSRRPFALKKGLLRRRLSFASLTGV